MTDAIVYTAKKCPYSKLAIKYLQELGIRVKTIDVGMNIRERNKLIEETKQAGIPVIKIKDQIIIGFDRNIINLALGLPIEEEE